MHSCRNITTQWRRATQFFRKIYLSLYWKGSKGLLKVLLCERWVGDLTELQHIDPHSHGHNSVSVPFSGTCSSFQHLLSNWSDLQLIELQLLNRGSWGPPLLGTGFLYRNFSPTDWTSCAPSYIIVRHPPSSCGHHKSHSFNPSTVKVISWYSSTGCTRYLHRCISYFDSLAGVSMQHNFFLVR